MKAKDACRLAEFNQPKYKILDEVLRDIKTAAERGQKELTYFSGYPYRSMVGLHLKDTPEILEKLKELGYKIEIQEHKSLSLDAYKTLEIKVPFLFFFTKTIKREVRDPDNDQYNTEHSYKIDFCCGEEK